MLVSFSRTVIIHHASSSLNFSFTETAKLPNRRSVALKLDVGMSRVIIGLLLFSQSVQKQDLRSFLKL